jgi:uncharacterized radical SAM protein YgiQ
MSFLPTSAAEVGAQLDVVLVTGDAYVDHPAWGVALIGRWLEAHGFSVGIIGQPDWRDVEAFRVLGRPRLFFGITAGAMDSMVNRFTASRHIRRQDAYTPGGVVGARPDRATIPYCAAVRQAYRGVPVVIGGIEASLRRFAHFDWWQDKTRGSMLIDSKADLLVFGMGERAVLEIARRLDDGAAVADCRDIRGICYAFGAREELDTATNTVELPSHDECRADPKALAKATVGVYRESNPHCAQRLVQRHGQRMVVQNPPALPLDTASLDRLYELPYAYAAHPSLSAPVPALASVAGSVTITRGCAGGCSFCSLTAHQGRELVCRSPDSVLRELHTHVQHPDFKGIVSDMGGPTANMYSMACMDEAAGAICRRRSCLMPKRCRHFSTDHGPLISLLRAARQVPGVRRVFINSGIRTDLADEDFIQELAAHHVQGQLSVAPEHGAASTLRAMNKPPVSVFLAFKKRFEEASRRAGKDQYLVPYFMAAHPGTGEKEAIELAIFLKHHGFRPRQVQLFMPTPGTLSTAMYVSGIDPYTGQNVHVARGNRARSRQRALMLYWKSEEAPHVREALKAWGREDLIGKGASKLVSFGPAFGAWQRR